MSTSVKTVEYPNGDKYTGEVNAAGHKHGKGKMEYASGWVYEGDFCDDIPEGEGRFVKGNSIYTGQIRSGAPHGQGKYEYSDGWYEGQFVDGRREGPGTFHYRNHKKLLSHSATFRNNDPVKGPGVLEFVNGSVYAGDLWGTMAHGQGTMRFADGDEYTGSWKREKMSGQGTLTSVKRKFVRQGSWLQNKWTGEGTTTALNPLDVQLLEQLEQVIAQKMNEGMGPHAAWTFAKQNFALPTSSTSAILNETANAVLPTSPSSSSRPTPTQKRHSTTKTTSIDHSAPGPSSCHGKTEASSAMGNEGEPTIIGEDSRSAAVALIGQLRRLNEENAWDVTSSSSPSMPDALTTSSGNQRSSATRTSARRASSRILATTPASKDMEPEHDVEDDSWRKPGSLKSVFPIREPSFSIFTPDSFMPMVALLARLGPVPPLMPLTTFFGPSLETSQVSRPNVHRVESSSKTSDGPTLSDLTASASIFSDDPALKAFLSVSGTEAKTPEYGFAGVESVLQRVAQICKLSPTNTTQPTAVSEPQAAIPPPSQHPVGGEKEKGNTTKTKTFSAFSSSASSSVASAPGQVSNSALSKPLGKAVVTSATPPLGPVSSKVPVGEMKTLHTVHPTSEPSKPKAPPVATPAKPQQLKQTTLLGALKRDRSPPLPTSSSSGVTGGSVRSNSPADSLSSSTAPKPPKIQKRESASTVSASPGTPQPKVATNQPKRMGRSAKYDDFRLPGVKISAWMSDEWCTATIMKEVPSQTLRHNNSTPCLKRGRVPLTPGVKLSGGKCQEEGPRKRRFLVHWDRKDWQDEEIDLCSDDEGVDPSIEDRWYYVDG